MTNEVYTLIIADQFVKDLEKLSRQDQMRVRRALERLIESPHQGKKVRGAAIGQYRWRVGNLRIRYDVVGKEIQVLRVIKREDVYRKV